MSGPRVSVVVLAYNHAAYIGAALDSILAQQFDGELEIIVTEDASTDDTRSILETYLAREPHRIHIIARERNVGGKQNLLDGYAAATGEYIAVLDGDDYWEDTQKLALQLTLLEKNPAFSGCGHNTRLQYAEGTMPDAPMVPEKRKRPVYTLDDFIMGRVYLHSSSLLFRSIFKGGLPKAHHDVRVGDSFMCMLFAEQGPVGYIDRIMSVYRYTGTGVWSAIPPLEQRMATLESLIVGNEKMEYRHAKLFDRALVRYAASLIKEIMLRDPGDTKLLLRAWTLVAGHFPGMLYPQNRYARRWAKKWDRYVLARSVTPREAAPRSAEA